MLIANAHYGVIFAAAFARFFIGWAWFSVLFGVHWVNAMKELKREIKKSHTQKALIVNFLASLLLSFVLCHFTYLADAVLFRDGAILGALAWLGFSAITHLDSVLWEGQSLKLYFIKNGYDLVTFALMGGILAQWS